MEKEKIRSSNPIILFELDCREQQKGPLCLIIASQKKCKGKPSIAELGLRPKTLEGSNT